MLSRIVAQENPTFLNRWSIIRPVRTYCDIIAKEVYCPCDSEVLFVGRDTEGYYSVLLQICADVIVHIEHLVSVDVSVGQLVREGTMLGYAKKFCRISLGTLSKDECNNTIRIYDREYFKRNPEQLTPENLGFVKFNHGQTHYAYKDENLEDITNFSREQQLEYSQMEVQKVDE